MFIALTATPILHKLAEYALLREVDENGYILGSHIHNLTDAIERTATGHDILYQGRVVLIHRRSSNSPTLLEEYVHSSSKSLWGYPLPACDSCGNGLVTAVLPKKNGSNQNVTVRCGGCNGVTAGPGVVRPTYVIAADDCQGFQDDSFFWKPIDSPSPWQDHRWK